MMLRSSRCLETFFKKHNCKIIYLKYVLIRLNLKIKIKRRSRIDDNYATGRGIRCLLLFKWYLKFINTSCLSEVNSVESTEKACLIIATHMRFLATTTTHYWKEVQDLVMMKTRIIERFSETLGKCNVVGSVDRKWQAAIQNAQHLWRFTPSHAACNRRYHATWTFVLVQEYQ